MDRLYVANDSNPSTLYRNRHDGSFEDIAIPAGCAYSQDGKPQAGMGLAMGDYDRNGTIDIFKTNFAGDTSTLYANTGDGLCEDRTFASGVGINTKWLGWGVGFLDVDHDGWLDLFLVNGHVYPEVEQIRTEAGYRQRKVLYRNLRNRQIRGRDRPPWSAADDAARRDGAPRSATSTTTATQDVAVNNVHDTPNLYRLDISAPTLMDRVEAAWVRPRTAAPSARASASLPAARRSFARSVEAAAITRRTTCASMPAWAGRTASSASRCDGRTATRKCGKTCRFEKSSGSLKGREMQRRKRRKAGHVIRGIFVVTIAAVAAVAAQTRVPDAAAVASIRELIQSGQIAQAQERLRDFDSAEPLVAYLRGLALYHADDHAKAIDTLAPIVPRLAPGTLERREAEQVLGLALYGAGRFADALPYLEATRAWARDNIELQYFLGLAYLQTGKIDAARGALAVTFGVAPEEAAAHLMTAQMLIRLNLDEAAGAN